MQYNLQLNERQAKTVITALNVLSRIGMGQLEIVAEHIPSPRPIGTPSYQAYMERTAPQLVRDALCRVKDLLGQPSEGSYGIGHPRTTYEAKIAYDIECVLRGQKPMHYGPEPLATVEIT